MTGHIPDTFIETLLSRVDIVDVINERVNLRKVGSSNFVGLCPFHTEKTPSFSVNPAKQFYHCFGCSVHGDAIRFLMEYDGLHFVEAVETLAERVGLQVPKEGQDNVSSSNHSKIYDVLKQASHYFQTQLRQHPHASRAVHYLKSRGVTGAIAKKYGLGFASEAWDHLLTTLLISPIQVEDLISAGLVIRKEGGHVYDRFRDRIMFPILDNRGRVVGFGGRVIDKGDPKYLNSPETMVFNKGTLLYGLYEARAGNRTLSNLIVVEGYLDVVSLGQFGIHNVVATLGTSLTEKHLNTLFRYVSEIILCFDGDRAGREAAQRALKLCLPVMKEGRRVRFALLPEGEDPDSFIRSQGQEAFLDRLERSKSLSDFLFDSVSEGLDLTHIDGRAQLVTLAKPLISLLPAGVFQQMMGSRLRELAGLPAPNFNQKNYNFKSSQARKNLATRLPLVTPAIRAAAILCQKPNLTNSIQELKPLLSTVDIFGVTLLCALIEIFESKPTILMEEISEELPLELRNSFNIKELKAIVASVPEAGIEQEFRGAIQRLVERATELAMETLLTKSKEGELSLQEKTYLMNLLEKWKKIG